MAEELKQGKLVHYAVPLHDHLGTHVEQYSALKKGSKLELRSHTRSLGSTIEDKHTGIKANIWHARARAMQLIGEGGDQIVESAQESSVSGTGSLDSAEMQDCPKDVHGNCVPGSQAGMAGNEFKQDANSTIALDCIRPSTQAPTPSPTTYAPTKGLTPPTPNPTNAPTVNPLPTNFHPLHTSGWCKGTAQALHATNGGLPVPKKYIKFAHKSAAQCKAACKKYNDQGYRFRPTIFGAMSDSATASYMSQFSQNFKEGMPCRAITVYPQTVWSCYLTPGYGSEPDRMNPWPDQAPCIAGVNEYYRVVESYEEHVTRNYGSGIGWELLEGEEEEDPPEEEEEEEGAPSEDWIAAPAGVNECASSPQAELVQLQGPLLSDGPHRQNTRELIDRQDKEKHRKMFHTMPTKQPPQAQLNALASAIHSTNGDAKPNSKGSGQLHAMLKGDVHGLLHRQLEDALTEGQSPEIEEHTKYYALAAMASAQHGAAEASLLRMLQSEAIADPIKEMALANLVLLRNPQPELIEYIHKLANCKEGDSSKQDVKQTCRALVRHTAKTVLAAYAPEAAKSAVWRQTLHSELRQTAQEIVKLADSGSNTGQRKLEDYQVALMALGNMRDHEDKELLSKIATAGERPLWPYLKHCCSDLI